MNIALITINSGGTMGHYVPLKNLEKSLSKYHDVRLISQEGNPNILVPNQETTHSIGGCFEYNAWKDLVEAIKKSDTNIAVFSTFFDYRAIAELKKANIKTALLTYPLRDSHAQLVLDRRYMKDFDRVFIYEDFYKCAIDASIVSPLIHPAENTNNNDILVTCGGGGRPSAEKFYALIHQAIPIVASLHQYINFTIIDRLNNYKGLGERKKIIPWTNDFPGLINSHKLIISEAGYHTTAEIAVSGARAVLIPGARRIDNQELRAVNFSRFGLGSCIFPEEKVDSLIEAIEKELSAPSKKYEYKSQKVDETLLEWFK